MIFFGTPKTNINRVDPVSYDLVNFNYKDVLIHKFEKPTNVYTINGDFLYGVFYVKYGGKGVVLDNAIFEAKLLDAYYFAHILKESNYMGSIMKQHEGYFFDFEQTYLEILKDKKHG